jgi:hypothetical protein
MTHRPVSGAAAKTNVDGCAGHASTNAASSKWLKRNKANGADADAVNINTRNIGYQIEKDSKR